MIHTIYMHRTHLVDRQDVNPHGRVLIRSRQVAVQQEVNQQARLVLPVSGWAGGTVTRRLQVPDAALLLHALEAHQAWDMKY